MDRVLILGGSGRGPKVPSYGKRTIVEIVGVPVVPVLLIVERRGEELAPVELAGPGLHEVVSCDYVRVEYNGCKRVLCFARFHAAETD